MQETKILEIMHYNPAMTSAIINQILAQGWTVKDIFITGNNYKIDRKQCHKTLWETAEAGKLDFDGVRVGVRHKAVIFTIFLVRDVKTLKVNTP